MKLFSKIFLAFGLWAFVLNLAHAQGVTRICQQSVNSVTGANNCVDVSPTYPLNVTPAAGSGFSIGGTFTQPAINTLSNISSSPSAAQNISSSVAITAGTPGVVTWTGNTFIVGSPIVFETLGSVTALNTYQTYYVSSQNFVAGSTFSLAR